MHFLADGVQIPLPLAEISTMNTSSFYVLTTCDKQKRNSSVLTYPGYPSVIEMNRADSTNRDLYTDTVNGKLLLSTKKNKRKHTKKNKRKHTIFCEEFIQWVR